MADTAKNKKRSIKKTQTLRQKAEQASANSGKKRVIRAGSHVAKPIKFVSKIGKKEVYLPLPDNKVGRFLNKRRSLVPRFFIESFQELKQVKWPGAKETAKLTTAVFVFALFFGLIITLTDYGLDKLFKNLILK